MTDSPKAKSIKRRVGSIIEIPGKRGTTFKLKFDMPAAGGKRRTVYRSVKGTRKDAERELRRLMGQAEKGVQIDASKITLAGWITTWLNNDAKGQVSVRTWERYSELLNGHVAPRIGAIALRQVGPTDVKRLYRELATDGLKSKRAATADSPAPEPSGLAPRTIVHLHRVLSACLREASSERLIDHNPVSDVKPPSLKKTAATVMGKSAVPATKMTILDVTDITKLLDGVRDGEVRPSKNLPFPLILLALDSGARQGELLALRWSDFNPEQRAVRVDRAVDDTRTNGVTIKDTLKNESSRRTVTISARTTAVLVAEKARQEVEQEAFGLRLPDNALMFPLSPLTPAKPLRPKEVSKAFGRARKVLGFPGLRFHDLRHNCASHMLKAGRPITDVSRHLGHASPAITMSVYAHAIPERAPGAGLLDEIMPEPKPLRPSAAA